MLNTIEKYYIHEETYYDNQLNDRATVTPNIIFDTVLRNKTPTAAQQKTATHFPLIQLYVNHHTGHTAVKTPDLQQRIPSSHQNQKQTVTFQPEPRTVHTQKQDSEKQAKHLRNATITQQDTQYRNAG
jgi:ABC-type microcin C transport system permease subunit YejE